MHPYSVDTDERRKVAFFLALASIFFAWLVHKIIQANSVLIPWWLDVPSAITIYGLVYLLFDKVLWKIARKVGLIITPNLSGNWQGILKSSFSHHAVEKKISVSVYQTWTKIEIILETTDSKSRSTSASITTRNSDGPLLSYQYINEPKPSAVGTMNIHHGTCQLLLDVLANTLEGEYYSGRNRQNIGGISLKKEPGAS